MRSQARAGARRREHGVDEAREPHGVLEIGNRAGAVDDVVAEHRVRVGHVRGAIRQRVRLVVGRRFERTVDLEP